MRNAAVSSVFALVALACSSDSITPGGNPLAGNYTATRFMTTGSSGQTNQLLAGSTLQINLAADGITSGNLHMAASGGNAAFDVNMAGTWTLTGNTVDFTQSAASFVRDMTFTVMSELAGLTLVGNQVFSGTQFEVTLTRAP